MIDDILLFFDGIYVQYDSLIWPILFVSIGEYFLFIRLFGKHENCIVTPKRTNKEENKIISEKIDLIFSGINKKSMKRFADWILCRCYTDEQKGKNYKWFVFLNFYYIFVFAINLLVWLLALFIPPLKHLCAILAWTKSAFVDMPIFLTLVIRRGFRSIMARFR